MKVFIDWLIIAIEAAKLGVREEKGLVSGLMFADDSGGYQEHQRNYRRKQKRRQNTLGNGE